MFRETLNDYIERLQCSGKEFAEQCGLSEATVSRYKAGSRIPKPGSEDLQKLCRGIHALAEQKGMDIAYQTVLQEFTDLAEIPPFDYASLQKKFGQLCAAFSVNLADMAKKLPYDASYLSRIKSGKRKPAAPQKFASDIALYISAYYHTENHKRIAAELIGISPDHLKTPKAYATRLGFWLTNSENAEQEKPSENPVNRFLSSLDAFDLNAYIKSIRFDELKVPSLPFQLPTSKTYYGTEQMKNGELDFLKATALSKSKHSVFMYSDMPMEDMAADMAFSKKYMFGLAAMLKKGLHLNVVHNLNRPFDELMLGLECWIPLYMTGQITPYYLKGTHNSVFGHLLNVSGAAALSGECIAGFHNKGKYELTNNKDELAYYQERSACILKKAHSLMDIYREDREAELAAFLFADSHTSGSRKNLLSTLPIYTATDAFLTEFLQKRAVSAEQMQKILTYAATRRSQVLEILQNNTLTDEIPCPNEAEFREHPLSLSLSGLFCETNFAYTFEEYTEHLQLTKAFAAEHASYSAVQARDNAFVNIQILMHENDFVMISKNTAPTIHFVIRHPVLRNALENLEFPVL